MSPVSTVSTILSISSTARTELDVFHPLLTSIFTVKNDKGRSKILSALISKINIYLFCFPFKKNLLTEVLGKDGMQNTGSQSIRNYIPTKILEMDGMQNAGSQSPRELLTSRTVIVLNDRHLFMTVSIRY